MVAVSPSERSASAATSDTDSLFTFTRPVQLSHASDVEAAAQLRQGRDRGRCLTLQAWPDERRRLVRLEEASIIFEYHQVVPGDEPIGGLAVHDVDGVRGERAVLFAT